MRVLDLFAGLGGWSAPFHERGHEVVTVDNDPRFGCTYTADILDWEPEGDFDIVLASPPCEKFSLLAIGKAWLPGYVPRHSGTVAAMDLVRRTVSLIDCIRPAFWVVENPRAILRKLGLIPYERRTVTYCQYGEPFMKPTDLWGGFPPSLAIRPPCRNGDGCHLAAPRGSTTGIQGDLLALRSPDAAADLLEHQRTRRGNLTSHKRQHREVYATSDARGLAALRAKIPHELALDVCLAAERDLALGVTAADYSGRLFA